MEEAGHVQVVGGPDDVVEEEEVVLEGGQVLLLLPLWDVVRPALEVLPPLSSILMTNHISKPTPKPSMRSEGRQAAHSTPDCVGFSVSTT